MDVSCSASPWLVWVSGRAGRDLQHVVLRVKTRFLDLRELLVPETHSLLSLLSLSSISYTMKFLFTFVLSALNVNAYYWLIWCAWELETLIPEHTKIYALILVLTL